MLWNKATKTSVFVFLAALSLGLKGCKESGDQIIAGDSLVDVVPSPSEVSCNPMGEPIDNFDRTQGVAADLFYLKDSQPRYSSVVDYINEGIAVDGIEIFFNKIDVPTRPFDEGFETQDGEVVLTPQGDTLYEYFAVSLKGQIHLGEGDQPGKYQLAVMSDDGTILQVQDPDGSWNELINNDGVTPTRMGCAMEPVELGADTKIPFKLDYFQGPRYHIALMVLWRPWPHKTHGDPFCGQYGNTLYFDPAKEPPRPQPAFRALQAHGWQVLDVDNYSLPEDENNNHCNAPAPEITNFQVLSVGSDFVDVAWQTDIPATSQVIVENSSTGEIIKTSVNSNMTTDHQVLVLGLSSNSFYELTAVSSSSSGRTTESAPLQVRTNR